MLCWIYYPVLYLLSQKYANNSCEFFVMILNHSIKTSNLAVVFRPVTDFNEIASHFIECIYVHIYNTKSRVAF